MIGLSAAELLEAPSEKKARIYLPFTLATRLSFVARKTKALFHSRACQ